MPTSAGLLLFRRRSSGDAEDIEVLLVHPGGPFWKNKDDGAWFVPKGLVEDGEELLAAARREFEEELGLPAPEGPFLELGSVVNKSRKTIHAWGVEGELAVTQVRSNTVSIPWPPRSGKLLEIPEIDAARFYSLAEAAKKMSPAEAPFLGRLRALLAPG